MGDIFTTFLFIVIFIRATFNIATSGKNAHQAPLCSPILRETFFICPRHWTLLTCRGNKRKQQRKLEEQNKKEKKTEENRKEQKTKENISFGIYSWTKENFQNNQNCDF